MTRLWGGSRAERRYRADARIVFVGLTLYSRSGVGGAHVSVSEDPAGQTNRVKIQFAAGSLPERAAGLNRFGFIEEVVEERDSRAESAEYLGLMSTSPEKDLDQAKQSLQAANATSPLSAICGSAGGGRFNARLYRTTYPASLGWRDCPALAEKMRALLSRSDLSGAVVRQGRAEEARTFLYAVRQALLSPHSKRVVPFLYNGTTYMLETRREADARMGRRFLENRLVSAPEHVIQLRGTLNNIESRSKSEFRLWYESGIDPLLPVRFEYRPRSFLHLAFEYDPTVAEPAAATSTGQPRPA
jgi:hypothetical protein